MIKHVIYDERPENLLYIPLPDGKADIWLRKNIREYAATEMDGESAAVTKWAAEEAYMRTNMALEAIESDIEGSFVKAAAFMQGDDEKPPLSEAERIALLERENAELFRQLTDAQLALCELFESMI